MYHVEIRVPLYVLHNYESVYNTAIADDDDQ